MNLEKFRKVREFHEAKKVRAAKAQRYPITSEHTIASRATAF